MPIPNLEDVQFEDEDGEYRSSCDSHYTISNGLGTKYLVEFPVNLVTILGNPDSCELPKVLGEITSDGSDSSQPITLQGIGAYAFAGRTNIKSISLPGSVEAIHEKAFEGTNAIIERNEQTCQENNNSSCDYGCPFFDFDNRNRSSCW